MEEQMIVDILEKKKKEFMLEKNFFFCKTKPARGQAWGTNIHVAHVMRAHTLGS